MKCYYIVIDSKKHYFPTLEDTQDAADRLFVRYGIVVGIEEEYA